MIPPWGGSRVNSPRRGASSLRPASDGLSLVSVVTSERKDERSKQAGLLVESNCA